MVGAVGAAEAAGSYYYAMQGAMSAGREQGTAAGTKGPEGIQSAVDAGGVSEGECRTCAERKYLDGSDDPGVSFQTPTHISPETSASAVMSHEMEHVTREQGKASREGREVVSQRVQLHSAICPECGKPYIAGGTTTTTTVAADSKEKVSEPGLGQNFDKIA